MKKQILFISCLLFTIYCFAQDAIYKTDNTKIEGKVMEVGTSEIKYKPASNPDGPAYVISKHDLVLITYQNGSHELFASVNKSSQPKFDSLSVNFCRNLIGLDIAEFTNTSIGMIYERTFGKKGMFAVRLPFSVSLNKNIRNYDNSYVGGKIFSTGLDFMYFPTGQGVLKYYAAPYFEWGMFRYRDFYYWDFTMEYSAPSTEKSNGQHYAGGIKNGLLFQPTRHFSISADVGFGVKKDETYRSGELIQANFRANVIIGYRF